MAHIINLGVQAALKALRWQPTAIDMENDEPIFDFGDEEPSEDAEPCNPTTDTACGHEKDDALEDVDTSNELELDATTRQDDINDVGYANEETDAHAHDTDDNTNAEGTSDQQDEEEVTDVIRKVSFIFNYFMH